MALTCGGCTAPKVLRPSDFLVRSRPGRLDNIQWIAMRAFDFQDANQLQNARIMDGEWRIRDGCLVAEQGSRNRTILLAAAGADPLRVEFEARLHANDRKYTGDITVLLNVTDDQDYWKSGYALTTGSFYNNCSSFYRLGRHMARSEHSPVVPGRWHRVALEYDAGHIRYWFDGRILLEAWDSGPLPMDAGRWIGLRTWDTRMDVRHLVISRARTPE